MIPKPPHVIVFDAIRGAGGTDYEALDAAVQVAVATAGGAISAPGKRWRQNRARHGTAARLAAASPSRACPVPGCPVVAASGAGLANHLRQAPQPDHKNFMRAAAAQEEGR